MSVLEYRFEASTIDIKQLETELVSISGAAKADVRVQQDDIEIGCYNCAQDMENDHDLLFAVCYIARN